MDDHSDEKLIKRIRSRRLFKLNNFYFLLWTRINWKLLPIFLGALQNVIKKNSTSGEKIALCSNSNMALQNMYNNIYNVSNRGEVKGKNQECCN